MDWTGISYGDVTFPAWAEFIGWMLCIVSILCVPGYALARYLKLGSGSFSEVKTNIYILVVIKCRIPPKGRSGGYH